MSLADRYQTMPMRHAVGAILSLVPALGVNLPHGASYPLGILILFSLASLPILIGRVRLTAIERRYFMVLLFFTLWPLIPWYLSSEGAEGLTHLSNNLRMLLAIPVFLLLCHVRPDIRWLVGGVAAGCLFAGGYALLQAYGPLESLYDGRAHGATNPVYFGNISLLMAFLCLLFVGEVRQILARNVLVIAFLSGIVASLLSGTKGSWLAVPIMLVILFIRYRHLPRLVPVASAIAVGVLIVASLTPVDRLLIDRIDRVQTELEEYRPGEIAVGSTGTRMEVWRSAIVMIANHPLLGIGSGNFLKTLEEDNGYDVPETVHHFYNHAHNEYLNRWVLHGLPGILGLIALLVIQYRYLQYLRYRSSKASHGYIYAGLMVLFVYAVYSFTDIAFSRSIYASFYVSVMFYLMATLRERVTSNDENETT